MAGGSTPTITNATEEWTTTPAPTFQQENLGQVFYNSTSDAFKVTQQPVPGGTWASGGNLNTPGTNAAGATAGTQTASLIFAGDRPSRVTATELYDGTSWTTVNPMNTGRNNLGGAGTTTSALGFGGSPSAPSYTGATESYNGTTWTEVADLNQIRQTTGCGISNTSAIAVGGYDPVSVTGKTEIWNGTSWTEVNDLNTARYLPVNVGTSSLTKCIGGLGPAKANVEDFDGTSWTETTDINTARAGGGGAGSQPGALVFGGYTTTPVGNTENWDGSSWTEVADLAIARNSGGNTGAGTSPSAIFFSGTAPGGAATEEWNVPTVNSTLTAS
jgi:hypothetical protein